MAKSINVGELKEILERIQDLYALAGANGPAADFKRLITTLAGHEEFSVEQFVEETRTLLGLNADRAKPKKPKGSNEKVVEEHIGRLLNAGVNRSAFDAAMSKLREDARVQRADLSAIANRYLNEPTSGTFEFEFKSDDAAYRAMKRMFVERAQDESKAKIIKRMTG